MKIAISAFSNNLEGQVNPVFGRCQGYMIVDAEGDEIKNTSYIENTASISSSGAGVAATQIVIEQNVQIVISGNLGPNAYAILRQTGIKCYQANNLKIKEALEKLAKGTLPEINAPSTQSKFGLKRGMGKIK
jgi:predicted Fe-Mo cluster-binding NifX family protein